MEVCKTPIVGSTPSRASSQNTHIYWASSSFPQKHNPVLKTAKNGEETPKPWRVRGQQGGQQGGQSLRMTSPAAPGRRCA